MAPNTSTSTPAPAAIIDLCGGGDEDNTPAAQYAKTMTASLSQHKRSKRKRTGTLKDPPSATVARAAACADAIEIDLGGDDCDSKKKAAAQQQDPSVTYRRELGPIRFDFVDSFTGQHAFFKKKPNKYNASSSLQTNKLYKELLEYKLNLPIELSSSIFVRVCESRMDLIRALITGPEGTPYANGCFLFDISMTDYPHKAPSVKFLTTGQGRVRFNPNLYNCGKVCLSLLGTWSGPGWQANKSTLLQVLVSIQGLILVPDPFYNEPAFESGRGKPHMVKRSNDYNTNIRRFTLQHAMDDFLTLACTSTQQGQPCTKSNQLKDYPEFTSVVVKHFYERRHAIRVQLDEWLAADASLATLCKRVRTKLDSFEIMYAPPPPAPKGPPEVVDMCSDMYAPSPASAAKTGPPEVVSIDC